MTNDELRLAAHGWMDIANDTQRRLAALEAENERLRVALERSAALDDESTGNIRGTIARKALGEGGGGE